MFVGDYWGNPSHFIVTRKHSKRQRKLQKGTHQGNKATQESNGRAEGDQKTQSENFQNALEEQRRRLLEKLMSKKCLWPFSGTEKPFVWGIFFIGIRVFYSFYRFLQDLHYESKVPNQEIGDERWREMVARKIVVSLILSDNRVRVCNECHQDRKDFTSHLHFRGIDSQNHLSSDFKGIVLPNYFVTFPAVTCRAVAVFISDSFIQKSATCGISFHDWHFRIPPCFHRKLIGYH